METIFKNTVLGLLPNNWKVLSLESLIKKKFVLGHLDGNHGALYPKKDEFIESGVSYLSANCIINGKIDFSKAKYLSNERASKFKKGVAINNDVLFAHNATVGPVAHLVTDEKYVILGTSLTYYRTDNEKLIPRYLMYYMESDMFRFQYERRMGQSTRNQVPITIQKEFFHVVPPLPEQKKIAKILSTVDNHIDEVDGMIEDLKELKKGLMQKLLTEGIGHTEFKDSCVGKIPVEWEVFNLGQIGSLYKGKGISRSEVIDEGLPCIRYGEIYTSYDYYIEKVLSHISEESARNSIAITKGDIVFAGSGETIEDIGKAISYQGNSTCYVGGDTIIMKPFKKVDSMFLSYYLSTSVVSSQMIRFGQGSSIIHLYIDGTKKIKVALPPINEQIKIAKVFKSIDERRELLKDKKIEMELFKKGLMQQLLTGKTRVKIYE